MKTYLFDSLARFKRFSESLDIATTLSNKTWVVFNDSGERELYIFKTDGKVYITTNGIGYQGTWEWLSANKSLIIHKADTVFMLHPEIVEECVLVLTLDGTKDCVFLIEDQNRQSFAPQTLAQLQNHFEEKERKVLEAERREKMKVEQERRKENEQSKKEQQEAEEDMLVKQGDAVFDEISRSVFHKIALGTILIILIFVIVLCAVFIPLYNFLSEDFHRLLTISIICILIISIIFFVVKIPRWAKNKMEYEIAKYKAEHPNDPVNKYL